VDVTTDSSEAWHVQLFQTGLALKNGTEYVVTFKAKAAGSREIHVVAGIDQEDWHGIGLDETVQLEKDWKDYKYSFTVSEAVEKNNRIGFQLASSKGKVCFKDVTLTAAKKRDSAPQSARHSSRPPVAPTTRSRGCSIVARSAFPNRTLLSAATRR
jgi:hypothetical protein